MSETVTKENTDIIKTFVDYCNNNQTQKSYELLSNDCKEEFNNNINVFINDYYNRIFKTKKTYNLELLYTEAGSYTYKITYYEDNLLATGGTDANNNFEDYITIINQDGERKLNINNFIKNQEINKTQVTNNIEITIKSKKVYRSYEQYKIAIKNNNSTTILLSDGKNSEDICLLDKNDTKYVAFLHEIPEYNLLLRAGRTTELNISFNKIYAPTRVIEKIQFGKMDEEQNNEQSLAEKASDTIQDTKDAVRDGANLAKNVSTGNVLGAVKNGFSLLKNKKIRIAIISAILIPIIVIVTLAMSLFSIFDTIGNAIQSVINSFINLFTADDSWDGSITIKDEDIKKVIDNIQEMGFDMDDLWLLGDIETDDTDTDETLKAKQEEAAKKYVRKFLEAQLVTETPHYVKRKWLL